MLRPTAKEVRVLDDYKLLIKFDNGEVKQFDATGLLSKKPYIPLNNRAVFNTVRPNGITIEWIGDIDLCPDDLYYGSTSID
jgi:hypothetical protein